MEKREKQTFRSNARVECLPSLQKPFIILKFKAFNSKASRPLFTRKILAQLQTRFFSSSALSLILFPPPPKSFPKIYKVETLYNVAVLTSNNCNEIFKPNKKKPCTSLKLYIIILKWPMISMKIKIGNFRLPPP